MTASTASSCPVLLKRLFDGAIYPDAIASACSADVVWDDLTAPAPCSGRVEVAALLSSKFTAQSRIVIERISDGEGRSGGFTWHRECAMPEGEDSQVGLRGTLYAEINDAGELCYVREGSEPTFKPGEATEALLKAVTQNMERPPKQEPTYEQATPTTASGIARYLWEEAYPKGADPSEAVRLFSDDIRYEDFNYADPFVGKAAVTDFVNAFDIPGIEFVPLRISEGTRSCAFTWKVLVNGQQGPEGISFYEVDADGKVAFIRDIPAPSPRGFRPAGALAAYVDPELHVLSAAKMASAALGLASAGMGLLKPIFAAEARWQADTLADDGVRAAAAEQLDAEVGGAPVVIYTYGWSPFSTEALARLDATGCQYQAIELGPEWFLLDGIGSAKRALLLERHGQSSLPHVFIGGKSIGGLYSGSPGLFELERAGELVPMLEAAGAK